MEIRNTGTTIVNYPEFKETPLNQTFSHTGTVQTMVVPQGVTKMKFTLVGASGGEGSSANSAPGRGANITAVCNVTPGSTLYVHVGSRGVGNDNGNIGMAGMGGTFTDSANSTISYGGAGGGFSAVFTSNTVSQANLLAIAGGGGGAWGGNASTMNGGNAATAWPGNGSPGGSGSGDANAAGGAGTTVTFGAKGTRGSTSGGVLFGGHGGSRGNTTLGGGGGAGSSWALGDLTFNGLGNANSDGVVTAEAMFGSQTFRYVGGAQKYIVPAGVTQIKVNAVGAVGGASVSGAPGGTGANITTIVDVTPGEILTIVVGGSPTGTGNSTAAYGFGGAGGAQGNTSRNGGAGGGLSGVFRGNTLSLANALCIAGGGGGAMGWANFTNGGNAGVIFPGDASDGRDPTGNFGQNSGFGGKTSTQTAGGAGSAPDSQSTQNTAGTTLQGGRGGVGARFSTDYGGGGGGGGAYAGGGGAGGGEASGAGGGGSSYSLGTILWNTPNSTTAANGQVIVEPVYANVDQYTTSFSYTGNVQYWTCPAGVNFVTVAAKGASGGWSPQGRIGGYAVQGSPGTGANITSVVAVTPGTTYTVVVGGCPGESNVAVYGFGGNGGGAGANANIAGGAGGGLTGLFNGTPSIANALIVAGGGGGAGGQDSFAAQAWGGSAGLNSNGSAQDGGEGDGNVSRFGHNGGFGGTTSAAGAAGVVFDTQLSNPSAGSGLQGGTGGSVGTGAKGGGGGGGGYYAGGGGAGGGSAVGGGAGGGTWLGTLGQTGNVFANINTSSRNGNFTYNVFHGSMTITIG